MKVWIAKNKWTGALGTGVFIFWDKPRKFLDLECWLDEYEEHTELPLEELPEGVNPKWEDTEPIEVELIFKANNKED